MANTGSTSMTYNASSRRFKSKNLQEFARRKVDSMNVVIDSAGFFFADTSGPASVVPHADYTNVFTNSDGDIHPVASFLGKAFQTGTKWDTLTEGTKLQYGGDAFIGHVYAYLNVRPDASDNRIISVAIDNAGSGYTVAPTIAFTGSGSGEVATVILDVAAQTVDSIRIDNGGSGWQDNGTTAALTGGPGNAQLGAIAVGKATQVQVAIFRNGAVIDPDGTSTIIGDAANVFTSTAEIHFLGPIAKGDIFELRVKNDSTANHSYHVYNAILSVAPIQLAG